MILAENLGGEGILSDTKTVNNTKIQTESFVSWD